MEYPLIEAGLLVRGLWIGEFLVLGVVSLGFGFLTLRFGDLGSFRGKGLGFRV